jgi:DNA-binding XRE family transcriptional regulator
MDTWREVLSDFGVGQSFALFVFAALLLIVVALAIKYRISIEAKVAKLFYFRIEQLFPQPQSQQENKSLPIFPDRKYLKSGREVRRLRDSRRVRQHDLAKAINGTSTRMSEIETGKKMMCSDEIVRIALDLELSTDELADLIRLVQDEYP